LGASTVEESHAAIAHTFKKNEAEKSDKLDDGPMRIAKRRDDIIRERPASDTDGVLSVLERDADQDPHEIFMGHSSTKHSGKMGSPALKEQGQNKRHQKEGGKDDILEEFLDQKKDMSSSSLSSSSFSSNNETTTSVHALKTATDSRSPTTLAVPPQHVDMDILAPVPVKIVDYIHDEEGQPAVGRPMRRPPPDWDSLHNRNTSRWAWGTEEVCFVFCFYIIMPLFHCLHVQYMPF